MVPCPEQVYTGAVRTAIRVALTMLALALVTASHVQAASLGQGDEAPGDAWLQNHAEAALWSDATASGQAVATIPQFLGFFRAGAPVPTDRGRIFVYYPGDTAGCRRAMSGWMSARSARPRRHPARGRCPDRPRRCGASTTSSLPHRCPWPGATRSASGRSSPPAT